MPILTPGSPAVAAPRSFQVEQMPGVVYNMRLDCSRLMWQNAIDETIGGDVTDNGHYVGRIEDISRYAMPLLAGSEFRKPTLTSGYGLNNCLLFDNLVSPDYMSIVNSDEVLGDLFLAKRKFAIFMKIRPIVDDGTPSYILDSTASASSTDKGIFVSWRAGDNLRIGIQKGSSGVPLITYDTTATIPASGNVVPVLIMADGVNLYVRIGDAAMETAVLGAGLTSAAVNDRNLTLGARNSAVSTEASAFGGIYGALTIFDRPISANEFDVLKNHNPVRNSNYPGIDLSNRYSVSPEQVSGLHLWYDTSDVETMFEDTAGTTPILVPGDTAFNQTCALLKNKTPFTGTARDASHATLGPTLRAPGHADNGSPLPALFWDGSDDRLDFDHDLGQYESHYVLFVAKNLDPDLGSHFFEGVQYYVVTGQNYEAPQRFVWHPVGTQPEQAEIVNIDEDWNILEAWRYESSAQVGCNGEWASVTSGVTGAGTVDTMGPEANPGWWMDGSMAECMWFNVIPPDNIKSKLRRYLAMKWNIANVTY